MPLYNQNFLDLPFVGQVCNFYPMLNVAAVPILNITLRNNLLDALPIKKWVEKSGRCLFLLEDDKKWVKGVWSIILSIPVFVVVMFTRDVQQLVSFSGGVAGSFVLLVIPAVLAWKARKTDIEEQAGTVNQNKSPFGRAWIWVVLVWAFATIGTTCY